MILTIIKIIIFIIQIIVLLILIILIITKIIIFIRQIIIFLISILLIIIKIIIFIIQISIFRNLKPKNLGSWHWTQENWILTQNPTCGSADPKPSGLHTLGGGTRLPGSAAKRVGLTLSPRAWQPQLQGLGSPNARCLQPGAAARHPSLTLACRAWQLAPGVCSPTQTRTDHFPLNQKDNPAPLAIFATLCGKGNSAITSLQSTMLLAKSKPKQCNP